MGAPNLRDLRGLPNLPSLLSLLNLRHASSSWRGSLSARTRFCSEIYPSTRSISSWWEWMSSLAYTCFTWAFTVLRDTTIASSM